MLYELILINEIEQRAKIIFLSVGTIKNKIWFPLINELEPHLNWPHPKWK